MHGRHAVDALLFNSAPDACCPTPVWGCFLLLEAVALLTAAAQVFGVPSVSARFGTAPAPWNWGMVALARLAPKGEQHCTACSHCNHCTASRNDLGGLRACLVALVPMARLMPDAVCAGR